jgi:hypothetical protein
MFGFLKKLFQEKEQQKTITIKIDAEKIMQSVNASKERRKRILKNKPSDLPADAIRTIHVKREKNPSSLSKYPVFYITGTTGEDTIEAFINSNPRARIISFYVNGSAPDFQPGKNVISPIYNIVTGEFRIVFEENTFMAAAIREWLKKEYNRILADIKAEYGH